jgi:hypothetical protein
MIKGCNATVGNIHVKQKKKGSMCGVWSEKTKRHETENRRHIFNYTNNNIKYE